MSLLLKEYLHSLFPNKTIKGSIGTSGVFQLLSTKAFFPDVQNISNLTKFLFTKKMELSNIARLYDIEKFGYNVKHSTKKDYFFKIIENSKFLGRTKDEYVFDIRDTTLPSHLTFFGQTKYFKFDDIFLNQLIKNLKNNSNFIYSFDKIDKITFDFDKRNIIVPLDKPIITTVKEHEKISKQQFKLINLVTAVVLTNLIADKESYMAVQNNQTMKQKIFFDCDFIAKAILFSVGAGDKKWISPEILKNYEWGKNLNIAANKIDMLLTNVSQSSNDLTLHKTILEHMERQNIEKEEKYIKNILHSNYSNIQKKISKSEANELNKRTIDEIVKDQSKISMILDSLHVKYTLRGNEFLLYDLESRDKQKKSPDAGLKAFVDVYIYKNFVNDSKGNIINFVMNHTNLDWIKAKEFCVNASNSIDYYEQEKMLRENTKDDYKYTHKISNLDYYIKKMTEEFKDIVNQDEYFSIIKETDTYTLAKKKNELRRRKDYVNGDDVEIKQTVKYEGDNLTPKSKVIKYWDIDEKLEGNSEAVKYLKNRGYASIPSCVKKIEGNFIDKNGKERFVNGVGIINSSGGVDLKIIDNFRYGDAQSFGKKSFTIINQNLIMSKNQYPERFFCVFESQWDYIAAYQDKKFRKRLDNSIGIILNGASSATQKCIRLINENKAKNTNVYLFTQADTPSAQCMTTIEMGIGGIDYKNNAQSTLTRIKSLSYSNEQLENKMDLNDILKYCHEKEIDFDVNSCFNKAISYNIKKNEKDIFPRMK